MNHEPPRAAAEPSSEESAELRKLRAEVKELRRANEILKVGVGFLRGRAGLATGRLVLAGHGKGVTQSGL